MNISGTYNEGSNRAEVKNMCLTEYNEAETMQMFKEEGIEEGLIKGREEGRIIELAALVNDGIITEQEAAGRMNMSVEEFREYAESI